MNRQTLYQFSYYFIIVLGFFIILSLAITSLFLTAYIPLNSDERVIFQPTGLWLPLALIVIVMIFINLPHLLERLSSFKLFSILSSIYLILGILLIITITPEIRADAESVYQLAIAFNHHDYSSLTNQGGYLYSNPHQLGLLTLERWYLIVVKSPKVIFTINFILIIANNFLLYKIIKRLFVKHLICQYTILLSFLFLPKFFFQFFAYGTIPGFFLLLLGFYSLILYHKRHKKLFGVTSIISFILAYLIRQNDIFFILAVIIIHIIIYLKNQNKKLLIYNAIIILLMPLSLTGLHTYYSNLTQHNIPKGTPKISYITMGLQENLEKPTLGGWWDSYNSELLAKNQYNNEKAEQQAKKDLLNNIKTLFFPPTNALTFFFKKVSSTWLEPTFQSIWTGPILYYQKHHSHLILYSLYQEKFLFKSFQNYSKVFLSTIYFLIVFTLLGKYLIVKRYNNPLELIFVIFFLGGYFFHFIWETKSQYVWIYIYFLLPLAAVALDSLSHLKSLSIYHYITSEKRKSVINK